MCIRDRSYQPTVTTQHEEESTEEKQVKSNELVIPRGGENTVILADGTTVPVSYTHLDVYKRQ